MALPAPACPEADPGHYRRKLEWEGPHRPDRGHFRQKLASGPGVRRRRHQPRTPLSSMSQTKTIPVAVAKVTKCTLWLLRIHLRVAEVTNCTFLDRSVRTGEGLLRQNPRIRIAASPCWPLTRGSGPGKTYNPLLLRQGRGCDPLGRKAAGFRGFVIRCICDVPTSSGLGSSLQAGCSVPADARGPPPRRSTVRQHPPTAHSTALASEPRFPGADAES